MGKGKCQVCGHIQEIKGLGYNKMLKITINSKRLDRCDECGVSKSPKGKLFEHVSGKVK